jgi:hypothetical protein
MNPICKIIVLSMVFTLWTVPMHAQPRPQPRLDAVAETRLLMEGLAMPNFQGINRHLRKAPAEHEAWVFIRGQALLIAETGNLLMLRPPRNPGERAWMANAIELRDRATLLARAAADKDYPRSKVLLLELAHTCDRCHQTFRVAVRIPPKE